VTFHCGKAVNNLALCYLYIAEYLTMHGYVS
jgi:hypothetical protein